MDSPCIKQTVCKVLKIFQHGKYLVAYVLNPFKPNEVSHCYQLEQPLSVSIDVGGIFYFYSNANRTFCKQTAEMLIRRSILCVATSHKIGR